MKTFLIGQRVIYNDVICVVCAPENNNSPGKTWVFNPEKNYKHWADNLKPLPGGQL